MKKQITIFLLLLAGCATPKEQEQPGQLLLGIDTSAVTNIQFYYQNEVWRICYDTVPVSAVVIADSVGILRKVPADAVVIEYERRQWNIRNRRYFLSGGGQVDLMWMIDKNGDFFTKIL